MQSIKSVAPGLIMIIVSIIILSQAFMMEKQSITDPAGGSFFPSIIAVIMLICGVVNSVKGAQQLRTFSHLSEENINNENAEEVFTSKDLKLAFLFFCLVLIYVALIPIIHFYPATFLFLIISINFLKGISWKVNLLVSLIGIGVIYLLFSGLFGIVFP